MIAWQPLSLLILFSHSFPHRHESFYLTLLVRFPAKIIKRYLYQLAIKNSYLSDEDRPSVYKDLLCY